MPTSALGWKIFQEFSADLVPLLTENDLSARLSDLEGDRRGLTVCEG